MFVQMICKDRNEKEMNELYEVLALSQDEKKCKLKIVMIMLISWFVHKERLL